jgi:poly(3-hydroxybutyrate) depolymerase
MSAGACLAAIAAMRFAKLFAAVGLHSGVACGAASNPAMALNVMAHGADADIDAIAFDARTATSPRALPLPVCIVHGEKDRVVAQTNSTQLLRQFLIFNGRFTPDTAAELPAADSNAKSELANGRTVTTEDYRLDGRLIARRICVDRLGHAWSGGDDAFAYNDPEPPDATRLFVDFFAMQLGRERGVTRAAGGKPWLSKA